MAVATPALHDSNIAAAILTLLARRDHASSACPSEIARNLAKGDQWRTLMPAVRGVLRQLMRAGYVSATRGGEVLTEQQLEAGPIRIRRGANFVRWRRDQ